ncbi:MAG: ASKHA domain-containing protein [Candidatus Omnitrophica bacterium]|nr:ASKHA domain-containing protein [Candidatus Omnitrophota bacterium]
MNKDTYTITFFHPGATKIEVHKGRDILSAALAAGIYINSSCAGDGVCGRCKVIIKKGEITTEPSGRVSMEERHKGYVLACQTTVHSDVEVEVPAGSMLDLDSVSEEDERFLRLKGLYSQAEDVDKAEGVIKEKLFAHSPLATKVYLKMPAPTFNDTASDLERLYRELRKKKDIPVLQSGLTNIKRLGMLLRESGFKVTALLGERNGTVEVISLESGDTSRDNYGVAFDIGTTTITGQLVDLNTRKILGTKGTYNKQAAFGSDVITRIIYAAEEGGLEKLHHAVIDNINSIIQELVKEGGVELSDVNAVMCAGNTTMIHLLLRVDPAFIRKEPYVATANFMPVIRAAEAGIKINPRGLLASMPGVTTYVGGDITAGVLASGINRSDKLSMLIDIGTNGEIALGNKDWLVSCAASAGPAFEGSGVKYGMRAAKGAIQRVDISASGKARVETIGNARPRGICGSGYIDCLAELFKKGLIDKNGKFRDDSEEFILVPRKEADTEYDITITEADIENLKRSKGAIYAAATVLLKKMDLDFNDIERFYIAGGFGTYLDIDKAVAIGMLPDLNRKKFSFIGNSSLVGAREGLLSYEAKTEAEEIARKMTYIELSIEPAYMDEYVAALFFPHTDLNRFPSVK